jgi:hypothetical protein
LQELKVKADKFLREQNQKEKQKDVERKAAVEKEMKTKKTILEELQSRGIKMGRALFDVQGQYEGQVYIGESGEIHWPVMFIYEEYNQTEFVKVISSSSLFFIKRK